MSKIKRGDRVVVKTAMGEELVWRAASSVEQEGHDFPVVWVTTEEEWAAGNGNGHQLDALPWPAEDVRLAAEVT
jgi:hypothetical protein